MFTDSYLWDKNTAKDANYGNDYSRRSQGIPKARIRYKRQREHDDARYNSIVDRHGDIARIVQRNDSHMTRVVCQINAKNEDQPFVSIENVEPVTAPGSCRAELANVASIF